MRFTSMMPIFHHLYNGDPARAHQAKLHSAQTSCNTVDFNQEGTSHDFLSKSVYSRQKLHFALYNPTRRNTKPGTQNPR